MAGSEAPEVQPTEFVTRKVRVPVVIPLNTAVVPLPVMVAPVEIVTVHDPVSGSPLNATLPVEVAQVGCVIVPMTGAIGAEGSVKDALTPVAEVQPLAVI